MLNEILQTLQALSPEERKEVVRMADVGTQHMAWLPNPGPQTEAYFCEADEMLFGGEAGGGKSALINGLALTAHERSLLLRRTNKEASKFVGEIETIVGHRQGFNGQRNQWRLGERLIDMGGCQYEDDKQRYKGDPHDLIGFDELVDFTESQYLFIITWNRTTTPGQRCRVVAATNPPTRPEGLWVIKRWAAWLDPTHANPAKPGELRWYTTDDDGQEIEVDGPGPHVIGGREVRAKSRTFIRSRLSDNPDLAATDYGARLDALPAELRTAYRDGRFEAALRDDDFQVIPTAWVLAAEARWRPDGHRGLAMTAMGVDPAGGGRDAAELAMRYGGWFAEPVSEQGNQTADGSFMAGWVTRHRRNNCPVVVDLGGGYGGALTLRLKDNNVPYLGFNGANASLGRTVDGQLGFANRRAEAYWRFREALDPDQEGGSAMALPPVAELRADLCAPHWKLTPAGILVESKEDIKKRIGRSPGKGDAAVMCLSEGDRAAARARTVSALGGRTPQVIMGHQAARRRR